MTDLKAETFAVFESTRFIT